jgi:hypothetical protein
MAGVTIRPLGLAVVFGLAILTAYSALTLSRINKRTLHLDEIGITVKRNGYRLAARWSDIVEYTQVPFARFFSVDVFELASGRLLDASGSDLPESKLATRVIRAGAHRRIQIGVYASRDDQTLLSFLSRFRPELLPSGPVPGPVAS